MSRIDEGAVYCCEMLNLQGLDPDRKAGLLLRWGVGCSVIWIDQGRGPQKG